MTQKTLVNIILGLVCIVFGYSYTVVYIMFLSNFGVYKNRVGKRKSGVIEMAAEATPRDLQQP